MKVKTLWFVQLSEGLGYLVYVLHFLIILKLVIVRHPYFDNTYKVKKNNK